MFAAGKLLLAQIEKRLNERFEALKLPGANQKRAGPGWRENFEFRADLPLHYVRREDYLRAVPFWKQNWMRYIAK